MDGLLLTGPTPSCFKLGETLFGNYSVNGNTYIYVYFFKSRVIIILK